MQVSLAGIALVLGVPSIEHNSHLCRRTYQWAVPHPLPAVHWRQRQSWNYVE